MNDQEDYINLGKIVFDDNNEERKSRACSEQACSRLSGVFLYQFFVILLIIFGCSWEFTFQKPMTNPLFGWKFSVLQRDTSYYHQDYAKVSFYNKSRLFVTGRSPRDGKLTSFLQLAQNWNLLTKL